jgi:arylsulfatase A-like enzyme
MPRIAAAARWLAPSLIAACLGAVVAGLAEGAAAGFGPVGTPASAGYAALLAVPACLAGALAVRGLWAAWRPHRLAPALVEDGGGAPRLAAWLLFLFVGAVVLSWATFNGVRILSRTTTFQVNVVALALPLVVVVVGGLLAAVSRPAVDVLAAGVRAADRRLRLRSGRSRMTPSAILAVALVVGAALITFAWFKSIKPRVGPLDLGILLHPVIAVAVTGAAHPVWRRLSPRRAVVAIAAPTAIVTVVAAAAALWVRAERPSLMLAIWAEPSIGGLAIETLFDVDAVRTSASMRKFRPAARRGAPRRDLVLVTIDTVRYDQTPLGGGEAEMPTLAALGRRGAVFDRAFAPSNVTRRSMPAMMLGASPPRIRGRVVGWALRLDPRHVPVAERLNSAGYDTAGFFCCNSFWGPERKTGYARGLDRVTIDPDGEVIAEEARAYLEARYARPGRPGLTWLHFIEPHNWTKRKDGGKGTNPRDSRLRRYHKALEEVDGFLAVLVAAIDAIPEERRPILIVTSDHGEGFGDHGALYHSSDLYDTQLRVPFVIVGPGIAANRIPEPVSLTDLAPTMLDLAGFAVPADMDGRSLADLATGARRGDPDGGYAYAVMMTDRSATEWGRAVVRGRWKLIDGHRGIELYDLRADPDETDNVADRQPEVLAEMKRLLDERTELDATPPF